jgi:hypothetical protein
MRWAVVVTLVWGMTPTQVVAGTASRVECATSCAALIAQCATTCGAFANLDTSCRRAILRRCRREGVAICVPSTTATVTTTTAAAESSTTHPTTTTHKSTTSTTMSTGLSCANPRPLSLGSTASGDTGNGADHGPGVACMQNAEAPDLVYVVVPDADGTLTLSLTSEWDGGLYVRTTCDDPATELACVDQLGDNATEVLTLPVTAGATYYVYVDGYTSDSYGPYELSSDLQ